MTINPNHLCLLLGSNIDPVENLNKSINLLNDDIATKILKCSSVWESRSIGYDGANFLNAVVEIETNLSTGEFKTQVIKRIEKDLNRIRTENKNSPRTIDIDILTINSEIIDQEIWEFAHISAPLSELYPDLINQKNKKQLKVISAALVKDQSISIRSEVKLNL